MSSKPGSVSSVQKPVLRVGRNGPSRDDVTREEPLEIRVLVHGDDLPQAHSIAVTMRTPGDDDALALGFLYSEAIITSIDQVASVAPGTTNVPEAYGNVLNVALKPGVAFDPKLLSRNVYTTSSCGVCGRASLEAVHKVCAKPSGPTRLSRKFIKDLSAKSSVKQEVFSQTGSLHAAALHAPGGELLSIHEDIGRHNAVDKLVGSRLEQGALPASDTVLWVSGRGGFELVQKAAMAGIPTLAAVGAPSSLAVDLAASLDMTLIGFLRDDGFNVYSGVDRLEGV